MGKFESFPTVWVDAAIRVGVGLGLVAPGVFEDAAGLEVAQVNLAVAVLIWLMIYPMMLKVEPDSLGDVGRRPKGLALALTINRLVKPFTMAGLAFLFFRFVFADLVSAAEAEEYIAAMILRGVAPCPAMVFVVIPVGARLLTRSLLIRRGGPDAVDSLATRLRCTRWES